MYSPFSIILFTILIQTTVALNLPIRGVMTVLGVCLPTEHMCGLKTPSWDQNRPPWECINTTRDSRSCGGCVIPYAHGEANGRDCTIIPGATKVACVNSECVVKRCEAGWSLAPDRLSCQELFDEGD
ncbi:Dihydroxyacetone synthase [Tulasnella sp. 419]|nr:Dihydroxyacetone synthase [Tulasnella sp. 419]